MDRGSVPQYFAVACGAGYHSRVMAATVAENTPPWGIDAYAATTLRLMSELRSRPHSITIDGVQYEVNAAMVLVANCGEVIPPFVRLGPGIAPDDGLLDVVVVRADNLPQSLAAIWELLRHTPREPGSDGYVRPLRGREVTVETDWAQPVQLDGESGGITPFTASVVPGAI